MWKIGADLKSSEKNSQEMFPLQCLQCCGNKNSTTSFMSIWGLWTRPETSHATRDCTSRHIPWSKGLRKAFSESQVMKVQSNYGDWVSVICVESLLRKAVTIHLISYVIFIRFPFRILWKMKSDFIFYVSAFVRIEADDDRALMYQSQGS